MFVFGETKLFGLFQFANLALFLVKICAFRFFNNFMLWVAAIGSGLEFLDYFVVNRNKFWMYWEIFVYFVETFNNKRICPTMIFRSRR